MSLRTFLKQSISLLVGGLLMLALIKGASLLQASNPQASVQMPTTAIVQDALASVPVLSYQGRLLDPTTGSPKPNGSYTIQFKLYDVATGGAPLWSESVNVIANKGLFTAMLGTVTPLNQSQFDGRTLFLGVSISGDPEASPRQAIGDVAYAVFARNADKLDGKDATSFAPTTHTHDGAVIISGIVGEPRIDAAISRDNEIIGVVLASDGSGSGVDADQLDGKDATSFAPTSHTHDGAEIVSGIVGEPYVDSAIARDNEVLSIIQASGGPGSGINADYFDNYDSSAFAKTYNGVQVNQTSALAAGGQEYWFTFGWSPSELIVWQARPTTIGAKMRLEVEEELGSDGNITYWLRVYNTGSVASGYQLIRQHFYQ